MHFLNDPQYFAGLYTDPEAWSNSQEVANLDVFMMYSVFHGRAEDLVLASFEPDVAGNLWAAHLHSGVGDKSGAYLLLAATGVGVYRGGSYGSVRGAPGLVAHHLLAASESPIPYGKGPAIQMEPVDHRITASWGWTKDSIPWRQQQGALIKAGRMRDALVMAINDIRSKFGSKYNSAIQEAIQYAKAAGYLNRK